MCSAIPIHPVAQRTHSSIRIPAAYNGIYGLKPSSSRLPISGCVGPLEGQDCIRAAVGPMASTLSGLTTFTKAVLSTKPWLKDPSVFPMPWNDELYALEGHNRGTQLCFAIMWDDGMVKPHPPLVRALQAAKDALTAAGHKGIPASMSYIFSSPTLLGSD